LLTDIIVVKFGGSCLSTSEDILTAAKKIAVEAAKGRRIVVVVSALKGDTDKLLNLAQGSTAYQISREDLDEILSMGERTMVRLVTTALRSLSLDSVAVIPASSLWPLHTDGNYGGAEVDLERTEKDVAEKLLPILNEKGIPVVAGFLGRSPEGKVTTLGRGGSDISAVVLGRSLHANEVIFVKDVEGVLSADPKKIIDPQKIDFLEAEEAYSLASAGAKIIHQKALTYKKDSMSLRVVGFAAQGLSGGTLITGELKATLEVRSYANPLSMITMVATEEALHNVLPTLLSEALSTDAKIMGIALNSSSILLYVENASGLVLRLHELIKQRGLAKAIHCIDFIAMIEVLGFNLEQSPGVVNIVVSPLAGEDINLYGVLTISSSIKIFVPWSDREKALSLINGELGNFVKQGDVEYEHREEEKIK
jgi:aspartate kinase